MPNHTSDQHEWFQKSIEKDEKFKDFYVWLETSTGTMTPPNNWVSNFCMLIYYVTICNHLFDFYISLSPLVNYLSF